MEQDKEAKTANNQLTEDEEQIVVEINKLNDEITKTRLRNCFLIGVKINAVYTKDYGEGIFCIISKHTGININSLYKCCQIAQKFSEEDIAKLSDGNPFPVALKDIKANMKFGREKIMAIFAESTTTKDFKEALKRLREEENIKNNASENCPQGTILEVSTNATSSNESSQSGEEKLNDKEADEDSITDCDGESSTDRSNIQEKAGEEKLNDIKRNAGSTTDLKFSIEADGETPEDFLKQNLSVNESNTVDNHALIVEEKLQKLRNENEELREENTVLKKQNADLKKQNADLELLLREQRVSLDPEQDKND